MGTEEKEGDGDVGDDQQLWLVLKERMLEPSACSADVLVVASALLQHGVSQAWQLLQQKCHSFLFFQQLVYSLNA